MSEIKKKLAEITLPTEVERNFEFAKLPEIEVSSLNRVNKSIMPGKQTNPEIKGFHKENPTFPRMIEKARSATSVTTVYNGALPSQGTYASALLILNPNEIAQVSLNCPLNPALDYDLYLYEVKDDGTLGAVVASSTTATYFNTYPDGSKKTIDEGLSYINKGTVSKYYAAIVLAAVGGSETDKFSLTVSIDVKGSYDPAEANDSVYQAYSVSDSTIKGAYLNVVNDQDWFVWNPSTGYNSARIALDKGSKAKLEVYTTDGTHMILVNPDGNQVYQLGAYNYIRVYNDTTDPYTFETINYTLDILPWDVFPMQLKVLLDGDLGTDEYPNWADGPHFTFKSKLTPKVAVIGAGGYPVRNCRVRLDWTTDVWDEGNPNNNRTVYAYTETGIDGNGNLVQGDNESMTGPGIAQLVLQPPPSLGTHRNSVPGPKPISDYYDIEGVVISVAGGPLPYKVIVYHLAYSTWA